MIKIINQVSSGGIIFRRIQYTYEVALIGRSTQKKERVWCLPKGLVEKGESPEETSLREVKEETGLEGKVIKKLGDISYWYHSREDGARIHKTVHFYLLEFIRGNTEEHDFEVEEVRWFPIREAIDRLAYKSEREIMDKASKTLEVEV